MIPDKRRQSMTLLLDVNDDGEACVDLQQQPILLGKAAQGHMAVTRIKYDVGSLWSLGARCRYTLKLMTRDVDESERSVSFASFVKKGFFHPSIQVASLFDMWTLLFDDVGFVNHSDLAEPTHMSEFFRLYDHPTRRQISLKQLITRVGDTLLYFQLAVNEPMAQALGLRVESVDIGEISTISYRASNRHCGKPKELFVYCQELEKSLVDLKMQGLLISAPVRNPTQSTPYTVFEPHVPNYKSLQDLKSIHSLHFSFKDEKGQVVNFQDRNDTPPGRLAQCAVILDLLVSIDEHPNNGELWVHYATDKQQ